MHNFRWELKNKLKPRSKVEEFGSAFIKKSLYSALKLNVAKIMAILAFSRLSEIRKCSDFKYRFEICLRGVEVFVEL